MKKEEIKALLKQMEGPIHDDGPTVIMTEKGGKQVSILVTRKKDCIEATTGRFLKRTIRIPLEEIEE